MSVSFQAPQAFALLLLLPLVWTRLTNGTFSASALLRMAMAVCCIVFLAAPSASAPGKGTDVIVLVDRSASCAARADADFRELLPLLQSAMGRDDRLAVVGFGREAYIEKSFDPAAAGALPPDGNDGASNLASALSLAGRMADPARRTALLYLGDGRHTGPPPRAAAAREGGAYPFWYRRSAPPPGLEVAATGLDAPGTVQPRSAWNVGFSLFANAEAGAAYSLTRNGAPLAAGTVALRRGENRFLVRDAERGEGGEELIAYSLRVDAAGDAVPENNTAAALVRVGTAPKILHVFQSDAAGGGGKTFLARCLEAAALPVHSIRPDAFPRSPAALAPYAVVVLENCRLSAFPPDCVAALAGAVGNGLASLLVTGGANAFGNGGYHRSALDPLLPVGMELRNEARRGRVAAAIALDRSGSMSAGAAGGGTKMDLANLGAAESIRLLAETDQIAILAVDERAHAVIPLALADDTARLADLALSIRPMGGGIYTRTALEAAREELRKSTLANRQIILFADASDAEEQEGCLDLVRDLRRDGIGVSVVAMGEQADPDAGFLEALARAGGSEALFSRDAEGLPALFTQEITRVSRRGFVAERVRPARTELALAGLAAPPGGGADAFPEIDGYNASFPREGSEVFYRLNDEFATPVLALRRLGRTATAAALFEIEGEFAGAFPRWGGAADLLVSLVRRIAPGDVAEGVKAYARPGAGVAEVDVEFSPEAAARLGWPELSVRWLGTGGRTIDAPLRWVAPDRAEARVALEDRGLYMPLIALPGAGLARGDAVGVAYPAEFAPGDAAAEERLLRALAGSGREEEGGGEYVSPARLLASGRAGGECGRDVSPWALAVFLALFLTELTGRRLALFR